MKKTIFYIACLAAALLSFSCTTENESTTTYSEALITSMTFGSNDSFPGLEEAVFTIITSTDTGMLYNEDSLRFGTCLDSVVPYLTFNHTPSYAIFFTGKDSTADTILYTGADTINFSVQPVELVVMASDGESLKHYQIYVHVHQVDPDLYTWECINDGIFAYDGAESKAVQKDGRFLLYVNTGFSTQLYSSLDAAHWEGPTAVGSLPKSCSVRKILEANGTLYYPDGNQLYISTDGLHWSIQDYSGKDFQVLNMLYCFNDSIWGIAQRNADQKLQLCNMPYGGEMALCGDILPDNFPVSEYSALAFAAASNRKRAMIVGGYDLQGNSLNTRWNIEYLQGKGYSMANFSIEQPSFASLTGASIVWYNNEFHMFGSVSDDNTISSDNQLVSIDEGLHWSVPDSTKNLLPESYQNRQKASVLVDQTSQYIYIIGGQNRSRTFSDVYRGRLTKLTFEKQD